MKPQDFMTAEAIDASALRKGHEGVKIGFEFEILIPAASVTAQGPQYDPNDTTWMNGKTVEDMIAKATQNNLSGWREPITDNFRIKPSKKAQVGGHGVIWDAYTAWGTKQIADANNNLEQRSKDILDAVKSALEELKGLVISGEVNASEIRSTINKFKAACKQGGDDVDLTRIFARSEMPTLTLEQIKKIKHVAHHCWIHTSGPIDNIWYKIKIADDYNSRYFGGMSGTAPIASTNFVRWIRETFGTTEIKELLKNWWTLRTSTTRPREAVMRKIWFWVTPDAVENTNRGESYTSEMTDWLKGKLEGLFGTVEVFRRYHERSKSLDRWYIEPDGSLRPNSGDYAAEVVGPPLHFKDALEALKKFVVFCKDNNIYTNSSTGLHINVSVPNQLDVLKLALFSGDKYALKTFGREQSNYARSIIDALKSSSDVTNAGMNPLTDQTVEDILQTARRIASDHFSSVNYTSSGYVSFRQAGGDYLNKLDSVMIVLRNFARAMVIASHPGMGKDEYMAKLVKLIPGKQDDERHTFGREEMKQRGIPSYIIHLVALKPMNQVTLAKALADSPAMSSVDRDHVGIQIDVDSTWRNEFINGGGLRPSTQDEIRAVDDTQFYTIKIVPLSLRNVSNMMIKDVSNIGAFAVYANSQQVGLRAARAGVGRVEKVYLQPGTQEYSRVYRKIIGSRIPGPRANLPESAILAGIRT